MEVTLVGSGLLVGEDIPGIAPPPDAAARRAIRSASEFDRGRLESPYSFGYLSVLSDGDATVFRASKFEFVADRAKPVGSGNFCGDDDGGGSADLDFFNVLCFSKSNCKNFHG